ncbi:DUF805 domain-containing protein [Shinella kummerowiae]|jgi:uncharacterized membrane protein YhaH (DUF805 family)|uniref:DUF805 domain-containing protein n=1 Tax=Shinella kummerowiae TaxID=417745 RepID=A0A6N8S6X8_9HYPH|nr:DUF805 domain-containing protein [Shinella kummerowiae]MXN44769.1 DUF805 domain-containing protein [Shinella kummerowiae]
MAAVEEQRPSLAWFFFGWSGRVSRVPFALGWAFWLMLLSAALARIIIVPKEDPTFLLWSFVFVGAAIVSTVSSVLMTVKRLHDMNLPVPLIICLFVPAISLFALIVFLVWPGTSGPNQYGLLPNRPKD